MLNNILMSGDGLLQLVVRTKNRLQLSFLQHLEHILWDLLLQFILVHDPITPISYTSIEEHNAMNLSIIHHQISGIDLHCSTVANHTHLASLLQHFLTNLNSFLTHTISAARFLLANISKMYFGPPKNDPVITRIHIPPVRAWTLSMWSFWLWSTTYRMTVLNKTYLIDTNVLQLCNVAWITYWLTREINTYTRRSHSLALTLGADLTESCTNTSAASMNENPFVRLRVQLQICATHQWLTTNTY